MSILKTRMAATKEKWERSRILFEIAFRLLSKGNSLQMGLTGWISMLGIVLGVACLAVSMGVMSGFEETLKNSLSDASGDVQIFRLRQATATSEDFQQKILNMVPEAQASVRFLSVEGVLAHQGRVRGVFMQGLDSENAWKVLELKKRVVAGALDLSEDGHPGALIGKAVASFFSLKPGDTFRLLVPLPSEFDPHEFRRKVATFKVAGVLELGKYEYDERMVIVPLKALQKLADVGDKDSGLILRLQDRSQARPVSVRLSENLGVGHRVRDWRDINENIFDAVELERLVIFFVILIIVIASSFNVATSLYVNVVQRYADIAVLKAIGMSARGMVQVLCAQGFLMGLIGSLFGLLLGVILGAVFEWAEVHLGILPASVYRIAYIEVYFRARDMLAIVFVTLVICTVATLAPARRGARLSPVEGLRYE